MAAAIGVRSDYTSTDLRQCARRCGDADQVRRLLALALILEGRSRSEAAKVAGVTLQIVRDWVLKFNAQGPDGLIDRKPPGQPSRLTDDHRRHLAQMIEAGPIPAVHGVVRWRLIDLIQWLWDEHRVPISKQTLSREVRALGYRKLSARPHHHAKSDAAVAAFKKISPRGWRKSRPTRPMASR
jgi:transposase